MPALKGIPVSTNALVDNYFQQSSCSPLNLFNTILCCSKSSTIQYIGHKRAYPTVYLFYSPTNKTGDIGLIPMRARPIAVQQTAVFEV